MKKIKELSKDINNHTWRGFTFSNDVGEYMFLNTLALNTRLITPKEMDRLLELKKKLNLT